MFAGKSPFVSIELSRTALVRAIKELEDKHRVNRVDRADASWSQRLDTLNRFLSNPLLQQAKRVLSKRRRAVYDNESEAQAIEAFETVLRFLREAFGTAAA
jgi:hypothetical protein